MGKIARKITSGRGESAARPTVRMGISTSICHLLGERAIPPTMAQIDLSDLVAQHGSRATAGGNMRRIVGRIVEPL